MSRDALEGLEGSDLDLAVALAWLVRDEVGLPEHELNAARRRAMLVLAAPSGTTTAPAEAAGTISV